jgi:SPP1 family phage portal protein
MKSKKPYILPYALECSEKEIADGIKGDLIQDYIAKHNSMIQRYKYLENMYKGFHDIFKGPDKENWKPDNRLAVNFPRYITDTFTGYGYGVPIKVTHPDEKIDDAIQLFSRQNEITDHEAEMVKKCCIYGHAFEFMYQNEEHETKVSSISPKEMFVVYDDKLSQRALFAVRYGVYPQSSDKAGRTHGEVYTKDSIYTFEDKKVSEGIDNPYTLIPCIEWRLNDERMGLFEPITGLVETYNATLGEKANDVDAFAEAYLAILGAELDEDGVRHIRDNRIINLYGTDNAKDILIQFLQKPTADGTQENLLNRLETLIYQISMVANISDESFGNATSGVSLAYKLQAMSNLALTFDRKIEKSLRKRYKIFCSLATNVHDPLAYQDIEIKTSRNIPVNTQNEAEIASTLQGVVSKETQLSVLSIVPDVKREIEKMEEEEEEARKKLSAVDMLFADENKPSESE